MDNTPESPLPLAGGWETVSGDGSSFYIWDDLSSSVPQAVDEDFEEDGEVGVVPATLDGMLATNQVYRQTILLLIAEVKAKLVQVRSSQDAMTVSLESSGPQKKALLKVPALLYVYPYFKDKSGMAAPRNEDSSKKLQLGEFDPLVQPPKKWTAGECSKLKSAVRLELLQRLSKSLRNKEELLEEKLASAESKGRQSMKKELAKLRKDIQAIESQGDSVLLEDAGQIDWVKIANDDLLGTRKPVECELKWNNELCPRWKQMEKWGAEDVALLEKTVHSFWKKGHPLDWDKIAEKLEIGRTAFQCFQKYQSELNPDMVKREWTKDEDQRLLDIIQSRRIGDFIPWDSVAYMIEGRTRAQCVSRFTRTLDTSLRRGRWTEEEDLLCLVGVRKFGERSWGEVASMVPGRTDAQCRERWCSVLDACIKLGDWTGAEDEKLKTFVKEFGFGKWANVSKLVPGRTPGMCKVRYLSLQKNKKQKKGMKQKKKGKKDPRRNVAEPVRARIQHLQKRKERVYKMYEQLTEEKLQPEPEEMEEEANRQSEEFLQTLEPSRRKEIVGKLNRIQIRYRHDVNKPAKKLEKEAQAEGGSQEWR